MNKDKAYYTKDRVKCKNVNFIAPFLTKMHTVLPIFFLILRFAI